MKITLLFLLLALTACDSESLSDNPEDSPTKNTHTNSVPDTILNESMGKTKDIRTNESENQTSNVDANDLIIRLLACNYIPILIDTNIVTGEDLYIIKWDCPHGFH